MNYEEHPQQKAKDSLLVPTSKAESQLTRLISETETNTGRIESHVIWLENLLAVIRGDVPVEANPNNVEDRSGGLTGELDKHVYRTQYCLNRIDSLTSEIKEYI